MEEARGVMHDCMKSIRGSIHYIPPEIFRQADLATFEEQASVDVWSLGIVCYSIFMNAQLLTSLPHFRQYAEVMNYVFQNTKDRSSLDVATLRSNLNIKLKKEHKAFYDTLLLPTLRVQPKERVSLDKLIESLTIAYEGTKRDVYDIIRIDNSRPTDKLSRSSLRFRMLEKNNNNHKKK